MDDEIIEISTIQESAINHIYDSFDKGINPICALDMGLGKTRIACTIINNFILRNKNYRILILIQPSNYIDLWINDLKKTKCIIEKQSIYKNNTLQEFTNCIYIHGDKRIKNYNDKSKKFLFPAKNIFISAYDTARIDIEHNRYDLSMRFDLIIYDELQTLTNTKDNTKKLISVSKLQSKRKLALSGTPIQNDIHELGLMYIFLNKDQLQYYLNEDNYTDSKEMRKEKERILTNAINDCTKEKALFFYYGKKSSYEIFSSILSLPIDPTHYDLAHKILKENPRKNLNQMFLSSPGSISYINKNNIKYPLCTKEEAVKIILKHMGDEEKAIIFSRYINVLHSYYDLCSEIGCPAIIDLFDNPLFTPVFKINNAAD